MKIFLLLSAVITLALAADQYTTKYDNINVEEVLKNDRLVKKYFECLIGTSPCTPDGNELKTILPDALKTGCSKCSEKQKHGAEKVINHLIENKPDMWKQLQEKFDPEGIYAKKYKAEAEKHNIKL